MINNASDFLAIEGGPRVILEPFQPCRSIGEEEVQVANRVLRSGVLSVFIGAAGPSFYGGPEVQALEREAAERFGVHHVLAKDLHQLTFLGCNFSAQAEIDQVVAASSKVWAQLETGA